jgi:hypothetical protein
MKLGLGFCVFVFPVVLATAGAGACTPAQSAELTQIENRVAADLQAGKTLEQIETDVAIIVNPKNPLIDTLVVILVNDALQILVDAGVIPPIFLPRAQTMLAQVRAARGLPIIVVNPDAGK